MKKKFLFSILCATVVIISSTRITMSQSLAVDSIMSSQDFFNSVHFVNLSKDDKSKDVSVMVEKGTTELNLQIGCIVNAGSLSFIIYDPNGKKQDGLSFKSTEKGLLYIAEDIPEANYNASKKTVTTSTVKTKNSSKGDGLFLRTFINPLPGKWMIKVIPQNVDGKFKINQIQTVD